MTAVVVNEALDELRGIYREPMSLGFSIIFPVVLFTLFATMWGDEVAAGGSLPTGTTMLATFGTFGALAVCMFNPGISIADDRERGWLRAKRVSPTPLPVTLVAKVLGVLPYAVGVLVAMTAAAAATGTLEASAGTIVRLVLALVVGALPFALISLAIGFRATTNTAVAVLQATLFPMVIASGLWFPLDMLPDAVARIAPLLPTYHLAQLGLAQLEGSLGLDHLAALAITAVVGAVAAAVSYRSLRP